MKPLRDGSVIYQLTVDPIELWLWVWVCQHGVGYPDICPECPIAKVPLDASATVGR